MKKLIVFIKMWTLSHSDTIRKLEFMLYVLACLIILFYLAFYIYQGSWPFRDKATAAVSIIGNMN